MLCHVIYTARVPPELVVRLSEPRRLGLFCLQLSSK